MRADLGALLHHDDRNVRRDLLELDRGRKARRPGADDHHVELHRFAGGKVCCTHSLLQNWPAPEIGLLHNRRERGYSIVPSHRRKGSSITCGHGFANRNARELLAFYRDAGVDALLGDEAIDRFADEFDRPRTEDGRVLPGRSVSR